MEQTALASSDITREHSASNSQRIGACARRDAGHGSDMLGCRVRMILVVLAAAALAATLQGSHMA
jgi:hypothetical protein